VETSCWRIKPIKFAVLPQTMPFSITPNQITIAVGITTTTRPCGVAVLNISNQHQALALMQKRDLNH